MTLVQSAVAAKVRAQQEESEIDEFWCVFDVEWPANHPHLIRAVQLAQTHGIHLAISNPCFELWLALHFVECRSWLDTAQAGRLKNKHDPHGKGIAADLYMPSRTKACERAQWLDNMHQRNGTDFPMNNPSSGMWLLIASATTPHGE